jgi:hypothetical protein
VSTENKILAGTATTTEISLWLKRRDIRDPHLASAAQLLIERARGAENYKRQIEALEEIYRKMPEPWRTLCADILANGWPRWWGVGEGVVRPPSDDFNPVSSDL